MVPFIHTAKGAHVYDNLCSHGRNRPVQTCTALQIVWKIVEGPNSYPNRPVRKHEVNYVVLYPFVLGCGSNKSLVKPGASGGLGCRVGSLAQPLTRCHVDESRHYVSVGT